MKVEVDFRECPRCHGYGVRDSGRRCSFCKGSGEMMIDRKTGKRITPHQLVKLSRR